MPIRVTSKVLAEARADSARVVEEILGELGLPLQSSPPTDEQQVLTCPCRYGEAAS